NFFFQAEDGIRDFHATGVQTCALPIYVRMGECTLAFTEICLQGRLANSLDQTTGDTVVSQHNLEPVVRGRVVAACDHDAGTGIQIGRASCRERVQRWMMALVHSGNEYR